MIVNKTGYWIEEFKKSGTRKGFINRILFHNGLGVNQVYEHTDLSIKTIRNWFRKFKNEKLIERIQDIDQMEYYKPTELLRKTEICDFIK